MTQKVNKDLLGKDVKRILAGQDIKINQEVGKIIVDEFFNLLADYLVDGADIDIYGFGKIENKTRAARKGVNPSTGEKIDIAEKRNLTLRPLGDLKKRLNP